MKNTVHTLMALAVLTLSGAAFAAEGGPTKGTKSYQSGKSATQAANQQTQEPITRAENTQNPQDIAPAAGAGQDDAKTESRSFREEMRLPRKN